MHSATLKKQVTRLLVFRATVNFMHKHNLCPNGSEIAVIVGISKTTANIHLEALRKADGLPMPILIGAFRHFQVRHKNFDEGIVPVDVAFETAQVELIQEEE